MLIQPGPLLWLVFGVVVGFLVGVLPGLSTLNTAALLLPFAITLPLENSLVLIVSIYAGAAFGGAVPAILFNVPGETGSAVTALDGYPMAKKGQAGLAIGIARMASVAGESSAAWSSYCCCNHSVLCRSSSAPAKCSSSSCSASSSPRR